MCEFMSNAPALLLESMLLQTVDAHFEKREYFGFPIFSIRVLLPYQTVRVLQRFVVETAKEGECPMKQKTASEGASYGCWQGATPLVQQNTAGINVPEKLCQLYPEEKPLRNPQKGEKIKKKEKLINRALHGKTQN